MQLLKVKQELFSKSKLVREVSKFPAEKRNKNLFLYTFQFSQVLRGDKMKTNISKLIFG